MRNRSDPRAAVSADSDCNDSRSDVPSTADRGPDKFASALIGAVLQSSGDLSSSGRSQIESLCRDPNPTRIVKFMRSHFSRSGKSPSFSRVCGQLRGHVQFLLRLAETPELQSLFLISDRDGNTFLSETAKYLIVEQAARTSQFLADIPETEFADVIPTIESQLGIKFDSHVHLENIRHFLNDEVTDAGELREMLWQEIVICDALRRFLVRSHAVDESALREQIEQEFREELESKERKFKRELKSTRQTLEREIRQQVSEELEAKLSKRIHSDLTRRLRREIVEELTPQIREQAISEIAPRIQRQAEKELTKQIRSEVIANLQTGFHGGDDSDLDELRARLSEQIRDSLTPKLRRQLTEELTPKIEESVREQTIAELTPRIRKEAERELVAKVSSRLTPDVRSRIDDDDPRAQREPHLDELARQLRSEVTRELSPRLRRQIADEVEESVREATTAKIRREAEADLVPRLSKKLRSEIIADLKQRIQRRDGGDADDQQLVQLMDELRSQLRDELTPKLRTEIKEEMTSEFDDLIRQRTVELTDRIREETERDLRPTLSRQIEDDLRRRLTEELEAKLSKGLRRQIESEVLEQVVEELRGEMEETIREKVRVELTPILTKQIRDGDDTDSQLSELYDLICEALGLTNEGFSRAGFLDVCRRIAGDVLELRTRFGISGDLVQFVLDLQCENAHLDQLHTQTRSLLVRQAQLISDLRQSAHTTRWREWADRLYRAIKRATPPADNYAAVRHAIEEYVTACIE
jgi:hypothetical protein